MSYSNSTRVLITLRPCAHALTLTRPRHLEHTLCPNAPHLLDSPPPPFPSLRHSFISSPSTVHLLPLRARFSTAVPLPACHPIPSSPPLHHRLPMLPIHTTCTPDTSRLAIVLPNGSPLARLSMPNSYSDDCWYIPRGTPYLTAPVC